YGMSMDAFIERGLSWVVRASYIEHKRPLHIGDTAEVETRVEEIEGRSVKVGFLITKEADGKAVAKGWLDYVLVSLENGRPQTIPDDIVAISSI
ncbi:MAG: thioesterase family protein, partial [Verrucomicrobiales bacterium]